MEASLGNRNLIGSALDVMQMPSWSPKRMSLIQVNGRGLARYQDARGLKELKSLPSRRDLEQLEADTLKGRE